MPDADILTEQTPLSCCGGMRNPVKHAPDCPSVVRSALSWIEDTKHGEKIRQKGLAAFEAILERLAATERERDQAHATWASERKDLEERLTRMWDQVADAQAAEGKANLRLADAEREHDRAIYVASGLEEQLTQERARLAGAQAALEHYAEEQHWSVCLSTYDESNTAGYTGWDYDGGHEEPWKVARAVLASSGADSGKEEQPESQRIIDARHFADEELATLREVSGKGRTLSDEENGHVRAAMIGARAWVPEGNPLLADIDATLALLRGEEPR